MIRVEDKVIITVWNHEENRQVDILVSLDISALELFCGLNSAFGWGYSTQNPRICYLAAENPIVLLRGNKKLKEYGIRDGSIIHFVRRGER